ncbi:luciferase family protein [Streptomyces sp. NPDC050504]|uniref:luciferase domain-containing protein n=1 Tax=Streptomyces sp. NPDC050504 TaxID=3365618 RepID=UPI0037936D75
MTVAHRAMTQLETWPDLVSAPPRCTVGLALSSAEGDVVHFHSEDSADVRLTRAAVQRLLPHLRHSSAIRVKPGGDWVTVLLDCDADIALLLTLVSVALKEHGAVPTGLTPVPCDWQGPEPPGTAAAVPAAVPSPAASADGAAVGKWRAFGRFLAHGAHGH